MVVAQQMQKTVKRKKRFFSFDAVTVLLCLPSRNAAADIYFSQIHTPRNDVEIFLSVQIHLFSRLYVVEILKTQNIGRLVRASRFLVERAHFFLVEKRERKRKPLRLTQIFNRVIKYL